ncbi:MAG: formate dehydrogenase subunit gamma [Acidobacteriota bacterium]
MSAGGRRLIRYDFRERLVHALAAVSYVYLLLTGLAFWTPALYWIAVVLGGGYLSRVLHPWAGLVFALVVLRMFLLWRRDMHTTNADRAWRKAMAHYVRNEDDRVPPAGRFNFGQKQLFWVMVWAALVLLLTGVVLWFPEAVPGSLAVVRELAVLLHAAAALVTIGAFIVHLYMGLFVVPGGLHAIVHGDVAESWARHHHPLWLESRRDAER